MSGKSHGHISKYKENLEHRVGNQQSMAGCYFRSRIALLTVPATCPGALQTGRGGGQGVPPGTRKCAVHQLKLSFQGEQNQRELVMGMGKGTLGALLRPLLKAATEQ